MPKPAAMTLVMAFLLAPATPSDAHTTWFDGQPVPAWVSRSCCGPADAHRLKPDQVHRVEHGYRIDGYPGFIWDGQVLPSEDGEYWAFYTEYRDGAGAAAFTSVYCFFVPSAG